MSVRLPKTSTPNGKSCNPTPTHAHTPTIYHKYICRVWYLASCPEQFLEIIKLCKMKHKGWYLAIQFGMRCRYMMYTKLRILGHSK